MAWWKYYWSPMFPLLYLTGCFPTHGIGHSGIKGMAWYVQNGYRTFIFPEGKTARKRTAHSKPYSGVSRFLKEVPDVRIVRVYVEWGERRIRPSVSVCVADAPKILDRDDPVAIMQSVYALANMKADA